MPTHYELLNLAPTATTAEVTRACDDLYDQWRRLTTHHDPGTAAQANQALQQIEALRVVLTDTAQRRAYDASIGLGGVVAGLADPAAVLRAAPPPPSPSPPPTSPAHDGATVSASLWACQKCAADNPPNTRFCFRCSARLLRECPECKQITSLVSTGVCGSCGFRYDIGEQRNRLRDALEGAQQQLAEAEAVLRAAQADVTNCERLHADLTRQVGDRWFRLLGGVEYVTTKAELAEITRRLEDARSATRQPAWTVEQRQADCDEIRRAIEALSPS